MTNIVLYNKNDPSLQKVMYHQEVGSVKLKMPTSLSFLTSVCRPDDLLDFSQYAYTDEVIIYRLLPESDQEYKTRMDRLERFEEDKVRREQIAEEKNKIKNEKLYQQYLHLKTIFETGA